MDTGLSQELKLEQRQVISVRLQQALQMLTLTGVELAERIEQELESNPALEIEREETSPIPLGDGRRRTRIEEIDWNEYFNGRVGGPYIRETDEPFDPLANQPAQTGSLVEHLTRQLEVICDDEGTFYVAFAIVAALDVNGYLRIAVEELAEEMGVDPVTVGKILVNVVQELDPPGVGARDLRECLLVQWRLMSEPDPLVGRLIEEHLDDIGRMSPALLAEQVKADEADVEKALDVIRSLEPRPGRAFGSSRNAPLVPDVVVDLVDDKVRVRIEDDAGSRLYISPKYRNLLVEHKNSDAKTKKYLQERIKAAAWFIRAIHQRRRTMRKVATAVFEHQRDFFERGPMGLEPLSMEDVAREVGVHVSTVSRATAGKVADTPNGIYPLRYFFTGAVTGDRGDVAVEKVKVLLKEIIGDEDPGSPYSDEALARKLASRGIFIARRTVAKYRKELNIPPKHERRKVL
jgi:RNA polymerase sigma-54 factor